MDNWKRGRTLKICLDAGHGMETPGKRTPKFPDGTFMHEYEFNSAVVKIIHDELIRYKIDVILTATRDIDVPLQERCDIANDAKADIFVSVHANAYGDGIKFNNMSGIETYHYPGSKEGKRLATIIHKHLLRGTPLKDRKVKTAKFYVLKYTHMPAVLCECGIMTNLQEAKLLLSDAYRKECAIEITQGILEYLGVEIMTVMDFQKRYELNTDNIAGPITIGKMQEVYNFMKPYIMPYIVKENKNIEVKTESITSYWKVDPLDLSAKIVNDSGKSLMKTEDNFVNGNFFSGNDIIGWLISDGKVLAERHEIGVSWAKPKGTFIVYKNGQVIIGWMYDEDIVSRLNDIKFCCQGFNLFPHDMTIKQGIAKEGFPYNTVGYSTTRLSMGYNQERKQVVFAIRKKSNAERAQVTMENLGCKGNAICLDSGLSANAKVNGKELVSTNRVLACIINF
jgi:N-acetylmuramoyl-L-alanine amidase